MSSDLNKITFCLSLVKGTHDSEFCKAVESCTFNDNTMLTVKAACIQISGTTLSAAK